MAESPEYHEATQGHRPARLPELQWDERALLLDTNNKIPAIKRVVQRTGCDLKTAFRAVDTYMRENPRGQKFIK
jgi:hypothetical protein